MGIAKDSVFPEPVGAEIMTFFPSRNFFYRIYLVG